MSFHIHVYENTANNSKRYKTVQLPSSNYKTYDINHAISANVEIQESSSHCIESVVHTGYNVTKHVSINDSND